MNTLEKLVTTFLGFSGERSYQEFSDFHKAVSHEKEKYARGSHEYKILHFIERKLLDGMHLSAINHSNVMVTIDTTREKLEKIGKSIKRKNPDSNDLGKVVDRGNNTPGNSDAYWIRNGVDLVLKANDAKVRKGKRIDSSYKYFDMRFLENYYGLRAFEFGNWLSQQDRINYVSGLGLALFDLRRVLGFTPKKLSLKGKLAVAFGARGRGSSLAHFEPKTFTINLTRYSRPPHVEDRSSRFKRTSLILNDGGVGAFAHEYGHALDYFGGMHVQPGRTFSLSGDKSTDPKPETELLNKKSLRGLMEKLLYKIIWKNDKEYTEYYTRLKKATKNKYYFQRNEIFARAFEMYVQYKLKRHGGMNIFLNEAKYDQKYYLTSLEFRRVEPEFDALMRELKKHC
jgi:hypothetical protein